MSILEDMELGPEKLAALAKDTATIKEALSQGLKYDQEKPRWDLLPLGPISRIVDVLTFGARKYAPNNWQKLSDPVERFYAAMMRHISAWRSGEKTDPESGLPHTAHIACCITFIQWFEDQTPQPASALPLFFKDTDVQTPSPLDNTSFFKDTATGVIAWFPVFMGCIKVHLKELCEWGFLDWFRTFYKMPGVVFIDKGDRVYYYYRPEEAQNPNMRISAFHLEQWQKSAFASKNI